VVNSRMGRFLQDKDCVFACKFDSVQYLRDRYTVTGNPGIAKSPFGPRVRLTGADYISIPEHISRILGTGDFSIFVRLFSTVDETQRVFFGSKQQTGAPDPGIVLYKSSTGQIAYGIEDTAGNNRWDASSTLWLTDAKWHDVLFVRDSGATIRVYVDGSLDTSLNQNDNTVNVKSFVDWTVGSDDGGGQCWVGMLANIIMWKRTLDADEAADLHYNRTFRSL